MNISLLGFLELPENIKGLKSLEHFDLSVNPLGRYVFVVTSSSQGKILRKMICPTSSSRRFAIHLMLRGQHLSIPSENHQNHQRFYVVRGCRKVRPSKH